MTCPAAPPLPWHDPHLFGCTRASPPALRCAAPGTHPRRIGSAGRAGRSGPAHLPRSAAHLGRPGPDSAGAARSRVGAAGGSAGAVRTVRRLRGSAGRRALTRRRVRRAPSALRRTPERVGHCSTRRTAVGRARRVAPSRHLRLVRTIDRTGLVHLPFRPDASRVHADRRAIASLKPARRHPVHNPLRPSPRARFRTLLSAVCCAALGVALLAGAGTATAGEPGPAAARPTGATGSKVVGYFTDWGVYDRNYHVKNIETSGSAAKLLPTSTTLSATSPAASAPSATPGPTTDRPFTADGVRGRRRRHLGPAAARQLQPAAQAEEAPPEASRSSGRSAAGPGRAASARRRRTRPPSRRSCHDLVEDSALGRTSSTASTSTGSTRTPAA